MTHRFETAQWVPLPVEVVFAFFANPSNLPHLMPNEMQLRLEETRLEPPPPRPFVSAVVQHFPSVAAGVGSEMLISFSPIRWFPRRFHWRVRITEFVWNSHFCDVQIQGPFAQFRHRHSIRPEVRDGVDGTLITDEIDFALPFGLIGRLGNATVRRLLAKSFGHRQQRLPEALVFAARLAAESR